MERRNALDVGALVEEGRRGRRRILSKRRKYFSG